jgi:myxalamid-type polyketide synthase MxaE and MxaD
MPHEPIAIVGLACRLPGAPNPAAFWELLRRGGDAIGEVPPDRWDVDAFYDPDPEAPGKMNTRWGGFLDRPGWFDRDFFKVSAWEASRVDPQQRLLLELAWEALEDAGLPADRLAGGPVGVFVGMTNFDYVRLALRDPVGVDSYALAGGGLGLAANRVSYHFDLCGPSLALDTACSSGLVAVHQACQSLHRGESELALAGAVSLMLSPEPLIAFTRMRVLSPDGRCRPFDAEANGFVFGEGGGLVVLKSLTRALADGDPIRAVIRGGAVNHNGRGFKMLAPHGPSQQAVLRRALADAEVDPARVRYVEANGTGSPLGDAIEARALGAVLAGRPDRCRLGSVKSNLGNLGPASGMAGLIKVVLALEQRHLPASLHFRRAHPQLALEQLPLEVQHSHGPWPNGIGPLLAGVSAFGIGGTNAHLVLEEAPLPSQASGVSVPRVPAASAAHLLVLSAASSDALAVRIRFFRDWLRSDGAAFPLEDICYTATVRRAVLRHRLAVVGRCHAELAQQLDTALPGLTRGTRPDAARRPKLAFVFPSRIRSCWSLGSRLLAFPAFRKSLEESDRSLRDLAALSLLDAFAAPPSSRALQDLEASAPSCVALQVALAALWRSWGIVPDDIVADALGRVTAGHVRGDLPLLDALHQALEAANGCPDNRPRVAAESGQLFLTLDLHPHLHDASGASLHCPGPPEVEESAPWLPVLGGLFVRGWPIDWVGLYPEGRVVPLPAYPWQRQWLWLDTLTVRERA